MDSLKEQLRTTICIMYKKGGAIEAKDWNESFEIIVSKFGGE
ncbi:MAG: hypothetical protein OEY24_04795 [Candidatus Bathyarchaeota archaeon]|nr:hypothetical protein [Candidatus Bathyarchaeota archaeon]MDH5494998.1 hypothetical protein [Candidatus Bathyarchaeota archaeon]